MKMRDFGGQPAAGRPYGKDWHCSLKGSQKTDDGAFSELCGEEPCRSMRRDTAAGAGLRAMY
jgi:hypothetical protein